MARSIAQTIAADFVPAKCSLYLRSVGIIDDAFTIDGELIFDATNFQSRTQGDLYIVFQDDAGATGAGCLSAISSTLSSVSLSASPGVYYPVRSNADGLYYVYVRMKGTGSIIAEIDGHEVATFVGLSTSWHWISGEIVIPDTKKHTLSFRLLNTDTYLDKVHISDTVLSPSGDGDDYSTPPFTTAHVRLAQESSNIPTVYYEQSWALNTLDNITKEGWYDFDLSVFDGFAPPASSSYAIALVVSGATNDQHVIWTSAEEYVLSSASMDESGAWTVDTSTSMSLRVYEFADNLDEYGCLLTTQGATLETENINNFESGVEFPKHQNTEVVDDDLGGNDVQLDMGDKTISLLIDQTGSMSWNDNSNSRFEIANTVLSSLENRYPGELKFNLFSIKGVPAFAFFVGVPTKIISNDVSEIISERFRGHASNFAGFRVLRNKDHYPETPIDGERVFDGYAFAALDTDLDQTQQYYYTIYTYDHSGRFSYGVDIPAATNVLTSPRGLPTFELKEYSGYDILRDDNVVALWNTDEGSGDYVYDFSDSSVSLLMENTRWLSEFDCPTGRYGIRVNGYSSTISSLSTNALNFASSDSFTLSAWVHPFVSNPGSCIIARATATALNWALSQDGLSLKLIMGATSITCSTALEPEEWSHVAVSYDGSTGDVVFYINGEQVDTGTISPGVIDTSDMTLNIGYDPSGSLVTYFGKMGHISVHNVVRSASYVADLASARVRYDLSGKRIGLDNGDRLVVASYSVPEDYNYNLIRIVRNNSRMPYHESDGTTVLETVPVFGKNTFALPYDYDVNESYWFRIFTKDSVGNWSAWEDSPTIKILIPDQDRVHKLVTMGKSVVEINPGPGYGSCSQPTISIARAGNSKVHIRWEIPAAACSRVKIYYSMESYATFDSSTQSIEGAELVFDGPSTLGEFVHRDIANDISAFYTIVTTDRLGKHSTLYNIEQLVPLSTADDSGIPMLEAINVAYHLVDYDRISITWDPPVSIPDSIDGWFGDTIYFYGAICDLYGTPLAIDFPENVKLAFTLVSAEKSDVENIFEKTDIVSARSLPKINFSVNSSGLITGSASLKSNYLLTVFKSISISISYQYAYSDEVIWDIY